MSNSQSGDNHNQERMHAHWRAKFTADLRKRMAESVSELAPVLTTPNGMDDKSLGFHYHDMDKGEKTKNFDQKIYMFPPAFNALRREIHDNWPTLWSMVSWYMANRPEEFCAIMNDACDVRVVFDSGAVNWMCDVWLEKLKVMRFKASIGVDGKR